MSCGQLHTPSFPREAPRSSRNRIPLGFREQAQWCPMNARTLSNLRFLQKQVGFTCVKCEQARFNRGTHSGADEYSLRLILTPTFICYLLSVRKILVYWSLVCACACVRVCIVLNSYKMYKKPHVEKKMYNFYKVQFIYFFYIIPAFYVFFFFLF